MLDLIECHGPAEAPASVRAACERIRGEETPLAVHGLWPHLLLRWLPNPPVAARPR